MVLLVKFYFDICLNYWFLVTESTWVVDKNDAFFMVDRQVCNRCRAHPAYVVNFFFCLGDVLEERLAQICRSGISIFLKQKLVVYFGIKLRKVKNNKSHNLQSNLNSIRPSLNSHLNSIKSDKHQTHLVMLNALRYSKIQLLHNHLQHALFLLRLSILKVCFHPLLETNDALHNL